MRQATFTAAYTLSCQERFACHTASLALAPLLVASAPSPLLSFMKLLLLQLHRRSQLRCTLLSKLGGRISDRLWSCLTSWSRLIDIKLVELVSGIHAPSFTCPAFGYLRRHPTTWKRHCADVSLLLLCSCRRDCCPVGGWHTVHKAARLGTVFLFLALFFVSFLVELQFMFVCGCCSLLEHVFGARLGACSYDGLLVLSWTIPLLPSQF